LYDELEAKLARIKRKESALVFATGYLTNLGVLPALVRSTQLARAYGYRSRKSWTYGFFSDEFNHLSIREGIRASGAPSTSCLSRRLMRSRRVRTRRPRRAGAISVYRGERNGVRLQKYLAHAGVSSRRKAEEFITAGHVRVNGTTVRELGTSVADGDRVSFFPGTGFSLSTVIDTLRHSAWWVRFNVTTAHRGMDHYGTPDIPAFAFNKPGVDLSAYDEIWFFGDDGPDLSVDENARIAKFMDNGGGVFATGDHDQLGAGMGAGLLRAGLMRKWKVGGPLGNPPPVLGATRHDTIVPGPDGHYDFYDQSDDRPQTISIRPRYGWSPFPWMQQTFPHALQDVLAGVQFVRGKAGEFGIDPQRIGLMGSSAGAHLASFAALSGKKFTGGYPQDPFASVSTEVKALIGVYGVYDMVAMWTTYQIQGGTENNIQKFLGASPMENRQLYFDATSMSYATFANNKIGVLLVTGTQDDLVDPKQHTEPFQLALKQAGMAGTRAGWPEVSMTCPDRIQAPC